MASNTHSSVPSGHSSLATHELCHQFLFKEELEELGRHLSWTQESTYIYSQCPCQQSSLSPRSACYTSHTSSESPCHISAFISNLFQSAKHKHYSIALKLLFHVHLFICLLLSWGSHSVAQAGLKLLGSSNHLT
jgi:hypothetical protein